MQGNCESAGVFYNAAVGGGVLPRCGGAGCRNNGGATGEAWTYMRRRALTRAPKLGVFI